MNLWTQEVIDAENDYRRHQLRRLAGHRRIVTERRTGRWHRWLSRGLRH
jgi:hypothetical protein